MWCSKVNYLSKHVHLMYGHLTWVCMFFPLSTAWPQGSCIYILGNALSPMLQLLHGISPHTYHLVHNVYTLSCTSMDNHCYTWYLFMLHIINILLHKLAIVIHTYDARLSIVINNNNTMLAVYPSNHMYVSCTHCMSFSSFKYQYLYYFWKTIPCSPIQWSPTIL